MMYSWIIVLAIVIWAVWYFGEKNNGSPFNKMKNKPIDILKRRFANGEITEIEYEKRRLILEEEKKF